MTSGRRAAAGGEGGPMARWLDRWLGGDWRLDGRRRRAWGVGLVVALALALTLQPAIFGQRTVSAGGPEGFLKARLRPLQGAPGLDQRSGPVDPPSVRSYPSSAADVQRWIDTFDMVKIR